MVDEGLTVLLEFRKHRNGGRSQVWVGKLFVKPCEKLFSAAARRLDKMVSFAVWATYCLSGPYRARKFSEAYGVWNVRSRK